MNRNYKVVWNRSLGCFTAVAEYAKARGKSSSSAVSSNSATSEAISSGAKLLRLTAICAGLAASGFSMQAMAVDGDFDNVTANGDVTASGTVNANGGLTVAGGQTVNMGNNKVTNVANGTATKDAVNFGQLEAVKTTANQGFNIKANSGAEQKIGPGETVTFQDGDSNIKITRTGNTISIATSPDQNFATVTTTGNTNVGGMLNANGGLTVAGGQTVNMGNNKVTNVANGTTTNDAVNFGQLDAVKTTANRGWDIQANGGAKQTIATGDTVNFTNGNNIVISRNGNAISVATSPNPNFTTVTTTGNVTVGGLTVTSNKTVNMGNNKVTNVANGTIAENGKDAATTGQLWKLTDGGDGVKYFHANSEQPDSEAIGQESIAIGPNTKSEGVSSLAAGDSASVTAQGEGAIALGQNATAGGAALGSGGAGAVAVGRDSVATGGSATALGDDAQASGGNATALGKGANASGGNSIALGRSTASSGNAFAAGNGAEAKSPDGISIGTGAGVGTTGTVGSDRRDNIAIGRKSGQNVIAKESIGIGFDAGSNVEGDNNTAIGTQAGMGITGEYNISMGYQANKNAGVLDHSTVVGSKANAGSNSVALGYEAQANNTDAVAVGSNAISNAQGLALGANSKSEGNNIALGFNSKALDSDSTNSSYLTGNVSGQGVVSVGSTSANITRRIVNVADGANGTDAVNVNQLKGAQQSVANLVGGGVPLNLDGSYGKITVNKVGGGTEEFDTVVDAIGAITSGSVSVLPPEAAKYNSDGTLDVAAGTLDGQAVNLGQLNTAIAENGIQYFSVNSTEGANRNNDGASGTNTIAIGPEASASGDESLALGYKARSDADVSIAIGNNVRAEGKRSTVLGNESRVYDANGVAIGYEAVSNGENSLVMGTGAESNEKITGERVDNAIVIGTKARSTASDDGIAIGRTALAKEDRAVAQGFNAESTADDAMAFGSRSRASGTSSQASGTDANASATNAQASGTNASASGFNAIAQGTRATGYATDGIAMGTGATSGFEDPNNQDPQRNTAGIAIGKNSLADEQNALALGVEAKARAKSATAVGDGARATDINALAMGTGAAASKQDATAIGREATANAQDATAFGRGAAASAQDAIAFGRGAQAREQGAMALGQGAKANTNDNDVALGAGSVTGAVVNTPNATIDKNKYTYAGTNAASTVSVGTAGNERTVTNVAAGRVSANSTDAINGSQLYGTNQAVTALGNNLDTAGQSVATALGGNSSYNPANHTVSANLNVNGTNYTNVESAIKYAAQGWNVQTNGDTTSNVAPGSTVQLKDGKNIKITRNGKDITVATADDVTFTKVTSGSMTVNNTDSTANGGTKNYVTQGSTSVVNGGDVYTAINTTNQQYQGDNGAVVTRNPNQVLKVKGGATTGTENNIQTVSNAADGSISVKLAEKIDLGTDGRVKIGSTTINNSGLSITGGPSITAAGINAGGKVITDVASGVGNDNNAANIGDLNRAAAAAKTEVAAGTNVAGVTKSTGGNGQDIYTVNAKGASTTAGSSAVTVTNTTDASTNVTNAAVDLSAASKASLAKADNSVQYDNAGKTSVTLGGAGASPVTITNVADGTLSTSSKDAVNGSQLHATNQNVATNKDNITNNTNAIAQGFNIGADNGADDNVQLGEKVDFNGDGNLITTVSNNAIGVSLADSITVGSTNPVTIDGNTGTLSGLTNQTISGANFADGSGRAATEEQLSAVNTTANKGWNVKVNDTASDNVAPGETVQFVDGKNIKITRDNDQVIKVATSDEVEFTKVTLGDGTNNTILTSTANGLDVGGDKITNVAPGTISDTSTDAINGSQLFDTAESVANNLGGGTTVNTDGTLSAPSYELDDGNNTGTDVTVNNVGAALGNLDGRTTSNTTEINKGIKFGNGTTNNQFALGDTINVKGDSNLTSTTTADGVQLGLGDSISVGQTNPVTIDGNNGTVSGLTNTSFDPDANYTGGQAATQEQLAAVNNATNDTINQGFNIAGANGSPDNVQLGETVTYDSTDGSIVTTVSDNNVDFTLGNDLNVGGSGEDGLITVNGKDGKNGVTINGKDGTIGINGKDGANGIITVANGVAGVDRKDGITRVVIDDIEVATMQDGLKFAGNTGDTIAKQLNETLNIEGELAESATASGANLRVDSKDGKLNLVMAKNLTDLNSATFGEAGNRFTINQGGVQFVDAAGNKRDNTPSMTAGGIDAGNNQITNVASGMTNVDGDVVTDINVANPNNGANIGDIQNTTTGLIDTGFNISADNSALADSKTVDNVKLGETVDFTNSDGNLVATVTDNGINYDLAENINVTSVTTGNTTLNNAGITIVNGANNTITLDGNGLNNGGNRIVNVAAGEVSTTSQDAINGGQLFGTANSIANNFGGGSTVNADGIVSAPNYVLDNGNGGTTAYDNVGDALGGLDNRVSTNADNITDITNGTAGIVRQDPDTGDITVGGQTGGTNVDFSGTEGDRVLTGAADGQVAADSNDVINGGQLFEQGSGVAGIVGGNTTYNPEDGTFTNNNIGGTGQNNINDAIQAVGDAASAGKNTVSEGNNIVVTETVDADTGSTNYEVATDPDLVVDSVTATDDEGNETTLTATGTTIINADGKTNNSTALGNTITDGDNVTTVTGSGTNVTDGDNTANYGANGLEVTGTTGSTVLNQAGVSFTDNKGAATGPSITANGIDAGGKTITGVADGVEVNDAVNLGQLNALDSKLSNSVNDLGYKIGEVEDDANAGISAAMAMSSLPQAYIPGKSMVGGGVATYNGESAVAIGVSRVSDNGRWVMKINGTADTQGNAGGAIGAGFHF